MHQDQSNSPQRQSNAERTESMNRKEFLAEAGRSLLGLLTLPAVASITGCGTKELPTPTSLADVLARPWSYEGKWIVVEGYVEPGNRLESHSSFLVGSGQSAIPWYSSFREQTYHMYMTPDKKGRSLPVLHSESSSLLSRDEPSPIYQGFVSVTGRFCNHPHKHGWVLSVGEMKSVDRGQRATP